ncbi:SNAA-like protein [Mya arenaria]|uniref:SNAA-like protein n=1 Tax=Mya arenaria TaxID=6604 RepID=A0ABY7FBW5_MYAAR|nr:SNAA-like protein [Mya arenaria]
MADNEQKASQYMEEAEKKLKSSKSAGECFCRASELQLQLGSKHEAATHYGRFTIAAKHHVSIAEIYENELADMDKAISSYQQAADYYKGEESNSSANKCLLKVAQYAAQLERYDQAIQIYEEIAMSCMDSSLLKYSAKDHFFRAAVSHLCVDTLNCQQALQRYEELFPQFADARECKLLKACEDEDADAFTDAIKEYDSISRLDQWTTTMLLRVKKRINQDDLK